MTERSIRKCDNEREAHAHKVKRGARTEIMCGSQGRKDYPNSKLCKDIL